MHENLQEGLRDLFLARPVVKQKLALLEQQVALGRITPLNGVRELLSLYESERPVATEAAKRQS
jgi:hypothetical protein